MSFTMDWNRQEGKWFAMEYKTLKWIKANNVFPKDHFDGFPWQMGWMWHHLHDYGDYKTRETQMHKMHKEGGWVVWCLHMLHEILEIWPLLTLNQKCLPCPTRKQLSSRMKV